MDSLENKFNFGVVEEGKVYRSAQPNQEFLSYLRKKYGIKTVICLKIEAVDWEKKFCEDSGLIFSQLAIKSWRRWPEPEEIKDFLDILNDPAAYPALIHCERGKDRTSAIAALYRLKYQNWTLKETLVEMKKWKANWFWRLFIVAETYKVIDGFNEKNVVLLYLKRALNIIFGIEGLIYAVKYERNIKIFLVAEAIMVAITLWRGISPGGFALLLLAIGIFNALEMINSAVERLADIVQPKFDYKIKVVKDLLAGAMIFVGITGFIAWLIVIF